ncbi:MAG: ATP-binding protein [Actinomycetia bacterium]|nr:ATP-binding protein [Actinomycetes bacterium]
MSAVPVPRPEYVAALGRFRDTSGLIKAVVGVRRCGKSTLLDLYRARLLHDRVAAASILSLDFESLDTVAIDSAQALHDHVTGHAFPDGRRYVFLDEVHLVPGWERAVNSLRLDDRFDIYVTGSNSRLLSSELAVLLSGRYVTIEVFPLSFAEYRRFRDADSVPPGVLLNDYLAGGGLPGQFDLVADARARAQYLDGVLNTVITKDIAMARQVRDVDALLKIVRYLAMNIGNLISPKGISDYFVSAGRRISPDTVDAYLTLLEQAYLFYRARREDLSSKEVMKTLDKFYLVDLGFRQVVSGLGPSDVGRLCENVVYLELRRRFQRVSVGKYGAAEVDFVAFDPTRGCEYFQVTQTMADEATRERELGPLRAIRDAYPKTVLSLDQVRTSDYNGIRHEYLPDWLAAGG